MEEMMAGADHLLFIPLADGAYMRSNGRVFRWINAWWGDWQRAPLVDVDHNNWFELQRVSGPWLWMPPPATMEISLEVFNEDRIAHPRNPPK